MQPGAPLKRFSLSAGGWGEGGVGVKKLHFGNKQATVKSVSEFD